MFWVFIKGGNFINTIDVNLIALEMDEEVIKVNVEGKDKDDTELTSKAVQILIQQLDLKIAFNEDKELFDKEMKQILQAIAENYIINGYFNHIAEDDRYYQEIEGTYELTDKGLHVVLIELINSLFTEKIA